MKFAGNTIQWNLDREWNNAAEMALFSSFDRVLEMDGTVISEGLNCETIKVVADGRDYYVKRYRAKTKPWWKAFGRSRASAEYRNLTGFSRLGIPVPRIVGYGNLYSMGLFRRGIIITEGVSHATDIRALVRTRPDLLLNRPWLLQVLRVVANYVRLIHEDGFTHGDLYWRNILTTATEPPRVTFIDCPKGSHKIPLRHQYCVVKDLAGLYRPAAPYLSRTICLRFYLWYRNRNHLTDKDKKLITRVLSTGR